MKRFHKVILASGHMIDAFDRQEPRFPATKVGVVRDRIAKQLSDWDVGAEDLAVCGGACGTDILFGELCVTRGAELWLMLPMPQPDFLNASVRPAGGDWEQRFLALQDHARVKTFAAVDAERSAGPDPSPFARNNVRIVDTGRTEARNPTELYAVLVWDEEPVGDGPGGTADFAERITKSGGHLAIINPLRLHV